MNQITGEQKLLAIFAHLSYFLAGVGFIIAPLVIFLIKKDDSFVYEHAKQALVAHLSIVGVSLLVSSLCILLVGVLLLPILALLWLTLLVTSVIGAIKAFHGEDYRYPLIQGLIQLL